MKVIAAYVKLVKARCADQKVAQKLNMDLKERSIGLYLVRKASPRGMKMKQMTVRTIIPLRTSQGKE
jgi:hypothetical protein